MAFRPIAADERERRLGRVRHIIDQLGLDALVVAAAYQISENRGNGWLSWLFGYRLEHRYAYGIVAGERSTLVFPEGMTWALENVDRSLYRVAPYHAKTPIGHELASIFREWGVSPAGRVGFVGLNEMVPVVDYLAIREAFPQLELVDVSEALEPARNPKTLEEQASAREATAIAEKGYQALLKSVRPGAAIREIGAEVYRAIFRHGAVDHILLTLHGQSGRCAPFLTAPAASDHLLHEGDVLTFSMELTNPDGYWVEFARTFALGDLDPEFETMVATGIAAMSEFERVALPGVIGGDIYRAVDRIIVEAGYHQGHTPGHSLGQDVLEHPRIAPYDENPLEEGMVLAFHPHVLDEAESTGSYLANCYLVTPTGSKPLSQVSLEPVRLGAGVTA